MKKLLIILLTLVSTNSFAQKSIELGISAGPSSYLGDLKDDGLGLKQNAIALGVQGRYNLNSRFAGRVSLNYGTIQGDDRKSDQADLVARNLNFRSRILEMAFIGEINFLNFGDHRMNKQGKKYYRLSPYVFGGIAVFNFNPETRYQGDWVPLQPLGTEGQDVPNSNVNSYNLTQISLPVGIGLKLQLEPNLIVSCELGWRKTFTDYLDDVSGAYFDANEIAASNGSLAGELSYRGDELNNSEAPVGSLRGDSDNDDWYILGNVTISYKLFGKRSGGFTAKY